MKKGIVKSPTRKQMIRKLDKICREVLLIRDSADGEIFRCISCGKLLPIEKAQVGHYASRRHFATRWDLNNIHLQCCGCNGFQNGNLLEYRKHFIEKIGIKEVERIERVYQEPAGYSVFDLTCIYNELKQKLAELKKQREA